MYFPKIPSLKWLSCQKDKIVPPQDIRKLFNLPKYIARVEHVDSNNINHFTKFYTPKTPDTPDNTLANLFRVFGWEYEGNEVAGKLPYAKTLDNTPSYLYGIFQKTTTLIFCEGFSAKTNPKKHGVGVCDTLEYIEALKQLEAPWEVEECQNTHRSVQELYLKINECVSKKPATILESAILLT